MHFEGELAVVIGRICRDVAPDRVKDVVDGYTIGNDVTARDLQKSDVQFTRAKGFDSFCPSAPGSRPSSTRATCACRRTSTVT